MLAPPILHRGSSIVLETFSIHFHPIFYLTSALHLALPFVPAAAYYSFVQALFPGLLGLSVFIVGARSTNLALAVIAALATAFCGPFLVNIGLPHIELAIPSLFLLFLALRSVGHRIGSFIALGLCLSVREDAGLHAGAVLTLLAATQWALGESRETVRENAVIAIICLAYSFSVLAFQHVFYPAPVSSLSRVYLGNPIGSHLSWPLVLYRATRFLTTRAYVTWPLILLLAAAVWKRNIILAVGPLSVLPWMLMSLLAASSGPGDLNGYYSFPVIIAIAWPTIAFAMNRAPRMLQLWTSVLSIVFLVSVDNSPLRGLGIPNLGAIGTYETALRSVISRRGEFGRLMVDDAVASLVPEYLITDEWTNQWLVDRIPNPDVVLYKYGAWDSANTMRVIQASGLTQRCRIDNTPFLIASREGTSYCR